MRVGSKRRSLFWGWKLFGIALVISVLANEKSVAGDIDADGVRQVTVGASAGDSIVGIVGNTEFSSSRLRDAEGGWELILVPKQGIPVPVRKYDAGTGCRPRMLGALESRFDVFVVVVNECEGPRSYGEIESEVVSTRHKMVLLTIASVEYPRLQDVDGDGRKELLVFQDPFGVLSKYENDFCELPTWPTVVRPYRWPVVQHATHYRKLMQQVAADTDRALQPGGCGVADRARAARLRQQASAARSAAASALR